MFSCSMMYAQTDINASFVDGTWTLDGSPYRVHVNIEVEDSHVLVIEPGVDVVFDNDCGITANGCLRAIGTEQDSIRFRGDSWSGICLSGTNWDVDSTLVERCVITGSSSSGIFCNVAFRVGIRHCRISENSGSYGGGILIYGSTPIITDNLIRDNSASGNGGGIYVQYNSVPLLARNTIINNHCNDSGGGIGVDNCDPLIYANTIRGNTASFVGGGIFLFNSASPISNNIILNNNGQVGGGVGIWSGCPPHLTGNIICNNTGERGGGIYSYSGNGIWLINNTVCNNYANVGGGICLENNIDMLATNSILWGNQAASCSEIYLGDQCDICFTNCCIEGEYQYFGGSGFTAYDPSQNANVLTANPLFSAPSAGAGSAVYGQAAGWMLGATSPCIDAGVITDDQYPLYNDVFGYARVYDGCIDIGAAEWQPHPEGEAPDTMHSSLQTLSNFPNPFNPETTITYLLPKDGKVTLNIFNINGQHVRTLFTGTVAKGTHSVKWDGKTDSGSRAGTGFFLYTLQTGNQTITRKMLLIK